jgi:multiple sugar transport system permease protein
MVPTPPPRAAGASRGASRRVGPTDAPASAAAHTAPEPAPRRRPRREKTRWWLYAVLFLGLVAMVMPFVWMILGSFKTDAEIRQYPTEFLPREPTVENYETLFGRLDFTTFFVNSIIVESVVNAAMKPKRWLEDEMQGREGHAPFGRLGASTNRVGMGSTR